MSIKQKSATPSTSKKINEHFLKDVLKGLQRERKELSPKYLYDERGSQLFDQICELDEYYLTRTEAAIMEAYADEMADYLGENCLLIELGSGSSIKTRLLLDKVSDDLAAYVPVDISKEHLLHSAKKIQKLYPSLEVLPLAADFTKPLDIPEPSGTVDKRVVYFPGSTIGNFSKSAAGKLLQAIHRDCGTGGGFLLGMDLKKSSDVLIPAYDDSEGVTAAFSLNLLRRMNRELEADFDMDLFKHEAVWNEAAGCVDISLVSQKEQDVLIGGTAVHFDEGERILTERSHKYDLDEVSTLMAHLGFRMDKVWTDRDNLFSVLYLTAQAI